MLSKTLKSSERGVSLLVVAIINYAEAILEGEVTGEEGAKALRGIDEFLRKLSSLVASNQVNIEAGLIACKLLRSDVNWAKLSDYIKGKQSGGATFFFKLILDDRKKISRGLNLSSAEAKFTEHDLALVIRSAKFVLSHEPSLARGEKDGDRDLTWIEKNHWDDLRDLFILRDLYLELSLL